MDISENYINAAKKYDLVFINSLLHHLDDTQLHKVLSSTAKNCGPSGSIHITDLILPDKKGIPYYLAKLDRGDFPRKFKVWFAIPLFNEEEVLPAMIFFYLKMNLPVSKSLPRF